MTLNNPLRQHLLKQRSQLTQAFVQEKSSCIAKRLQALEQYRQAKNVAFYYAIKGEVSLEALWHTSARQGKQCFFPVCKGDDMYFVPVTPNTPFVRHSLGVLEPDVPVSEAISVNELDIALMPLVAFDAFGVRMGMGKGFYDRAFASNNKKASKQALRLGIGYEFQRQTIIEKQPWDVLVHATVSEKNVYWTC